jgi:NAD+ synthase (glutamine-hydrolysing)
MSGGLAVISDVPKTTVYKLARYINAVKGKEIIPENIIIKQPSAELREGQKDSDSLPQYDVLDAILEAYIEENKSKEEIIASGFDAGVVGDVIWKVDHNEYKRQQAAIGIKITPKAFGSGRRMPITNRYEG